MPVEHTPLQPPDPPLTDGVIALRSWRDDDIPALVAACQDLEILRWTQVPDHYTAADARSWFATHAGQMALGLGVPLAVVDPGTGELLGSIELRVLKPGVAEVGYWVSPRVRRRGIATRAVKLVTRWGLETLGHDRMQLTAHPDNLASQAVARRAGFRREGVLRAYMEVKGRRRDAVMFSLLRADPPPP